MAAEERNERWEEGIVDSLRRIGFRIDEGARVNSREVTFALLAMRRMLGIDEEPSGPVTAAAIARAATDWEGIRVPLVLECSAEPEGPAVCAALWLAPNLAVTTGGRFHDHAPRFVRSPFWSRPISVALDVVPSGQRGSPPLRSCCCGRNLTTMVPHRRQVSPDRSRTSNGTAPARWRGSGIGTCAQPFRRLVPASSARAVHPRRRARQPAPLRERDRIFRELNDDAIAVFAFAEGLRLTMQEDAVHLGHLAIALVRVPGSEGARLLASINYPPEQLVSDLWGEGAIANVRKAQPAPIDGLPALSDNAWEAVSAAAHTARAQAVRHISPRHLIYGLLSVDKSRATQQLARLGIKKEDVALGVPPAPPIVEAATPEISPLAWRSARPGVASDTVAGQKDLLGLEREVEVLCSVIAARDVEPPLSIGLFGDWGTGKTFFMKQMEAWINRMKTQARARDGAATPSAYCTNVVQLWFNAWHYIDANLWASLTAEIFDGLGRALRDEAALTQGVDDDRCRQRARRAGRSRATQERGRG